MGWKRITWVRFNWLRKLATTLAAHCVIHFEMQLEVAEAAATAINIPPCLPLGGELNGS